MTRSRERRYSVAILNDTVSAFTTIELGLALPILSESRTSSS